MARGIYGTLRGDAENARNENAGLENAAQTCRGWKMRDWKMWHKNAGRENAGLEKAGKEKYGTPYARTHAFSFYAPSATALDRHAVCPEDGSAESDIDDDDNQEEEVSVDSGDDQSSADVGSQDLFEVCMIAQRDTRQALVPCGVGTPALLWFLYHKDRGRRPRLPDMPRANHHDSAPVLVFHS